MGSGGTIQKPALCPPASELLQLFQQVNLGLDLNLNALFQPSLLRTHLPCMKIHTDLCTEHSQLSAPISSLAEQMGSHKELQDLLNVGVERTATFQETYSRPGFPPETWVKWGQLSCYSGYLIAV